MRDGLTLSDNAKVTYNNTGNDSCIYFQARRRWAGPAGSCLRECVPTLRLRSRRRYGRDGGYADDWSGHHGAGNELGTISGQYAQDSIVNQGTIDADTSGATITVSGSNWINTGLLEANSGTLDVASSLALNGTGILFSSAASSLECSGNLLGNTTAVAVSNPQGTTAFDGSGTVASPQLLEAMSRDLGNVSAGFANNFDYGELALADNTCVELVDQSRNSAGSGPDAVYAQSIIVPAGCTLNLNGLHLYARDVQISGTIINGSIVRIPSAGGLTLATPTPGDISTAGELDEWTFFDYGGRTVRIMVNPGENGRQRRSRRNCNGQMSSCSIPAIMSWPPAPIPPPVRSSPWATWFFPPTAPTRLPSMPAGQTASTGNYLVAAYDVTPNLRPLNFDQASSGNISTPFALDQWNFAATAGQQIKFNLAGASAPGLAFTLAGPGGYTAFSNLSSSSQLIDLAASGSYTLTAFGPNGATGSYSFQIDQTTVTALPLATTL